ncbi:MAG TPA: hypothetical protein VF459_15710 [Caulobacteraceae bacterium]
MIVTRCVWRAQATLGEGPIWSERDQAVYRFDLTADGKPLAGGLFAMDPGASDPPTQSYGG